MEREGGGAGREGGRAGREGEGSEREGEGGGREGGGARKEGGRDGRVGGKLGREVGREGGVAGKEGVRYRLVTKEGAGDTDAVNRGLPAATPAVGLMPNGEAWTGCEDKLTVGEGWGEGSVVTLMVCPTVVVRPLLATGCTGAHERTMLPLSGLVPVF